MKKKTCLFGIVQVSICGPKISNRITLENFDQNKTRTLTKNAYFDKKSDFLSKIMIFEKTFGKFRFDKDPKINLKCHLWSKIIISKIHEKWIFLKIRLEIFFEFTENGNACSIYFIDLYILEYTRVFNQFQKFCGAEIFNQNLESFFWLWVMDKLVFGTWENMHHLLSRFLFLKSWPEVGNEPKILHSKCWRKFDFWWPFYGQISRSIFLEITNF